MSTSTQRLESDWGLEPLTVDSLVPTVMIRFHAGRHWHVSMSAREVLRDVRGALSAVSDPRWTRELRRETYRAALWVHADIRAEYSAVMRGGF